MPSRELLTLALERQRGWKQTVPTVAATTILGGLALLFTGSATDSTAPDSLECVSPQAAPASDAATPPCSRSAQKEPSQKEEAPEQVEEKHTPCGASSPDAQGSPADLLQPAFF